MDAHHVGLDGGCRPRAVTRYCYGGGFALSQLDQGGAVAAVGQRIGSGIGRYDEGRRSMGRLSGSDGGAHRGVRHAHVVVEDTG